MTPRLTKFYSKYHNWKNEHQILPQKERKISVTEILGQSCSLTAEEEANVDQHISRIYQLGNPVGKNEANGKCLLYI
jgi:hypothetical protein